MESLTAAEIIEINKQIGEKGTLINRGNLEFIVGRLEESRSVVESAATLLNEIINLHPFLEGNKRTAYVSMRAFLELNGKTIKAGNKIEGLIYDVANNKYSIKELAVLIDKMIE